ncbi:MAG: proline dehydrogenase [Flavobacteriales bacterium TMED191]|nr:MAG: proline dehydrogenase [Flavobacteriales bacterium TMED191]
MVFSNKYIDYKTKSKRELYETLILFELLSRPYLVYFGKYMLKFALQIKLPILGIIKKTIFKHFCGGEDIIESKKKIKELGKSNIKTILDYSVEGQQNSKNLEKVYHEIINNLNLSKNNNLIPFCVFKVTGITRFKLLKKLSKNTPLNELENKELQTLKNRLHKICSKAQTVNKPVLIDAEESWIQKAIDELVEQLMMQFNQKSVLVYNTLQFYRWDRIKYMKELHKRAKNQNFKIGIKIVRGAYMEKERFRSNKKKYKSPIHKNKLACDNDFDNASKYCLQNIKDISICFGTHNEQSTQNIIELMKEYNIENNDNRIFFSQLLGMSDNISFYLAHFNYNVAKYVPYGPVKYVIPYLIRRAEENSSIGSQTHDEIKRLKEAINNI